MLTNPNLRILALVGLALLVLYFLMGSRNQENTPAQNVVPTVSMAPTEGDSHLDGVLAPGIGQLHGVQHNNKFVCQDCVTCSPAVYKNDIDMRFENLENVRRIRALRGDSFPEFKLN